MISPFATAFATVDARAIVACAIVAFASIHGVTRVFLTRARVSPVTQHPDTPTDGHDCRFPVARCEHHWFAEHDPRSGDVPHTTLGLRDE